MKSNIITNAGIFNLIEAIIKGAITEQKTGILYLVKLSEMGFSDNDIVEVFEGIMQYANYLDEHIVSIRGVQDIIERKTGIKLSYRW